MATLPPNDGPSERQAPEAAAEPVVYLCGDCGHELAEADVACRMCGAPVHAPDAKPSAWTSLLPLSILALVLVGTFILKLHNLGQTALTRWDEVFHAIVAQNVFKHPLTPTLVDVPYLPYDATKWGENHVWLHKPILPFWQIALSFAALGVNTLALRLPSAILSTAAALVTYLIGKELYDRRSALIAAALQASSPFLLTLVHGYQFADHIDVALLFWVEIAVFFLVRSLRTASWRDLVLAGVAQGLAFHCKSYLAFIAFGVALTAWLLPLCRLGKREDCRIGLGRLLTLLGVTALTIAPWQVYCLLSFPEEYAHEHTQIWRHFGTDVEGWAAPWDRLVFDYMIAIHGVFYTPILVAFVVLIASAVSERHAGLWLLYAWSLGVFVPHLLATTKTPSATILAVPPCLLLLGCFVSEAWRRGGWRLVALAMIFAVSVLMPAVIRNPGYSYPASRAFGAVMREALWVIWHVAIALCATAATAGACFLLRGRLSDGKRGAGRVLHEATAVWSALVLGWLAFQNIEAAWTVTCRNTNDPHSVNIGRFVRAQLPDNAVLLCERHSGFDHLSMMFHADRTCYLLPSLGPGQLARRIVQAGGIPYVVSSQRMPYSAVFTDGERGATVYRWRE